MNQMVNLQCKKSILVAALKHLNVAVPKGRREQAQIRLEIDLRPDQAKLSVPGASYRIACTSNACVKTFLSYGYFTGLIETWEGDDFQIALEPGKLHFQEKVFASNSIQFVHPENQPTVDLTINYTTGDLLRLRSNHSQEELQRLNLLNKINKAEKELEERVAKTFDILKEYGVTADELRELVTKKLMG